MIAEPSPHVRVPPTGWLTSFSNVTPPAAWPAAEASTTATAFVAAALSTMTVDVPVIDTWLLHESLVDTGLVPEYAVSVSVRMVTVATWLSAMSARFHVTVVGPVPTTLTGTGFGCVPAPAHAVPAAITQRPSGTTSTIVMPVVFSAYSLVSITIVQVDTAPCSMSPRSTDFCTAMSSAVTVCVPVSVYRVALVVPVATARFVSACSSTVSAPVLLSRFEPCTPVIGVGPGNSTFWRNGTAAA